MLALNNKFLFPQIDAFTLEISHNEPVCDTGDGITLLLAEAPTVVILARRIFSLSNGDVLLALPHSYLRQRTTDACFYGYQITFPRDALRVFSNKLYVESADGGMGLPVSGKEADILLSIAYDLYHSDLLPAYALPAILSTLEKIPLPNENTSFEIHLPKLLRRALAYIEDNPREEIDVAQLAKRYEVSQSTLLRLFRQYLATTPRKYALALRSLQRDSI